MDYLNQLFFGKKYPTCNSASNVENKVVPGRNVDTQEVLEWNNYTKGNIACGNSKNISNYVIQEEGFETI